MPISPTAHIARRSKLIFAILLLLILQPSVFTLPVPASASTVAIAGVVATGDQPIFNALVTLYRSTKDKTKGLVELGTAKTNADGIFTIPYTPPDGAKAVLYLVAAGGKPDSSGQSAVQGRGPIRLATVIGTTSAASSEVVINERTTVATAFALAQFIQGKKIGGKSPGLQNAVGTAHNLVDITTGEIAPMLGNAPNGTETSTLPAFNSLANMLAACVRDSSTCGDFFYLATPPGGDAPRNTLQAALNIAHYPAEDASALFDYSQTLNPAPYAPALDSAPDAWTLAIKYEGNGQEFDGPGNMVFDQKGNLWITNNYEYHQDPLIPACGSRELLKLTPTGEDAPGAPYTGGGIYGAGYGLAIDPSSNLWVGNFGFFGFGCQLTPPPTSISLFDPSGNPISPAAGYVDGHIDQPQGMASDQEGNIWIVNCGSNSITKYNGGDHTDFEYYDDIGLDVPFDIAIDGQGRAWITSSANSSVVALNPDGTPIERSPVTGGGINHPLGIAVDSLGNVWVANSGILTLPCPQQQFTPSEDASVTLLRADGRPTKRSPFKGGGLTWPWGIAVDGDDNIWVANFQGKTLSQLCGARTENCPPGLRTGDPISPDTGYTSDALQRNTGVAIDPSGNVWVPNNWKPEPPLTNPGGDGMVVFIGLAAPVKTPLLGLPQKP